MPVTMPAFESTLPAGAPELMRASAFRDYLDQESTHAGAASTRLSTLQPSVLQDLLRFERGGRATALLEVVAAGLRHGHALLVHVEPALQALARTDADADAVAARETSPVVANAVLRISQSMYTPRDRTRTDLVVDDRPYAGLLALSVAWNLRHAEPARARDRLDTYELTLGVIGPASLARQAQDAVHDLIGVDRFLGWDQQLGNEPALQLAVERRWRPPRGDAMQVEGWSTEAIRSAGLRLGNIQTSAAAGIEWRAGWNLPNDFGAYPLGPGAENRPPAPGPQSGAVHRLPGAQVFASAELRAVAWDFSLDGNLLRSSHSVTREPLVAQVAIGWGVHGPLAGRGWRLTAMRVWRSREFSGDRSHHSFGSIALGVEW